MPRLRAAMVALALLGLVAAAALVLPHSPSQLRDLVLAAGAVAPLAALAAWVALTPALFPGTVLAAAGGLAFGMAGGVAVAWVGAVLGGLATFAASRTIARGRAQRLVARVPVLTRVHALVERRGFAAILAARLMPGVPATGLYYAAGASPVRPRAFAAAIAIGALLRTTPYALLGDGLASGSTTGIAVAVASIALGAGGAAVLVRQVLRVPLTAPQP
ncbi:MAG TPA: VTT domain-containing protein [Baekduia sp.]